jgi:hypothetical protein
MNYRVLISTPYRNQPSEGCCPDSGAISAAVETKFPHYTIIAYLIQLSLIYPLSLHLDAHAPGNATVLPQKCSRIWYTCFDVAHLNLNSFVWNEGKRSRRDWQAAREGGSALRSRKTLAVTNGIGSDDEC